MVELLDYTERDKMTKQRPLISEHDIQTNQITNREMNDLEFANYELEQNAKAIANAEAQTKATAKSDLLAKLGITAEEAALLLN